VLLCNVRHAICRVQELKSQTWSFSNFGPHRRLGDVPRPICLSLFSKVEDSSRQRSLVKGTFSSAKFCLGLDRCVCLSERFYTHFCCIFKSLTKCNTKKLRSLSDIRQKHRCGIDKLICKVHTHTTYTDTKSNNTILHSSLDQHISSRSLL